MTIPHFPFFSSLLSYEHFPFLYSFHYGACLSFKYNCFACLVEALEGSADSTEWTRKRARNSLNRKRKSILLSITSFWVWIRRPQLKRFVKPFARRPSRNILIKEETLKSSNRLALPIKFFLTLKRDSSMMTMERKESRMEDHLEVQALEGYLICSLGEDGSNQGRAKESLN